MNAGFPLVLFATVVWTAVGSLSAVPHSGRAQESRERLLRQCAQSDDRDSANACRQLVARSTREGDGWILALESEVLIDRLMKAAEDTKYHQFAVYLLRVATQRFPGNPKYHYRLARLLLNQWDAYEEAYGRLLRSVEGRPTFLFEALVLLGEIERRLGRFEQSVDTYSRALRANEQSVEALTGLAESLAGMKKYPEAAEKLQQAMRLSAADEDSQRREVLLADALFWTGRGDEAAKVLIGARARKRRWDHQVWCGLATVFRFLGEDGEERQACSAAQEERPCGCMLRTKIGSVEGVQGFSRVDADVTAAVLKSQVGTDVSPVVVEELTAFALSSAQPAARDTIAMHLRRGVEGFAPQVAEAVERLLTQVHVSKRVQLPEDGASVDVVSRSMIEQMARGRRPPFYTRFAGADGLVTLSSPTYSQDGTAAVIFMLRTTRIDQQSGKVLVLRRIDTSWRFEGAINATWVVAMGR